MGGGCGGWGVGTPRAPKIFEYEALRGPPESEFQGIKSWLKYFHKVGNSLQHNTILLDSKIIKD